MRAEPIKDQFFETLDRPVKIKGCDCPGCAQAGDYRAPKSRSQLNDYYWFCLEHVREYNSNWDYFSGMSMDEIEAHIRKAVVWDRPSWPVGQWRAQEQHLRDEVMRDFFTEAEATPPNPTMPKTEFDALTELELNPPVDFSAIKAQYRILVKRHHPDLHGGSPEAEEKFKLINQAFATLRQIYGTEEAD